ncbi:MAG: hypothetical protein ACHQAR_03050 [Steroidobacterales bacterium]
MTNAAAKATPHNSQQRRRVRRAALLLALVAFAVYAGFIVMSVMRAHS